MKLAVAGAAPALAIALVSAHAAFAAGALDASQADALSAKFIANGFSTTLPPVALVFGSAPPAYNKTSPIHSFTKVLRIPDASTTPTVEPAFYVDLSGILDHVSGSDIGIDNYGSEGDTRVASVALALNLNPPPPTAVGAVPEVPLQVTATGVTSSANYNVVVPRPPVVSGSASFGSLTVTGSLVGNKTLTYHGTPPANYTLYSSPEVTIILNQQVIEATLVTCIIGRGCEVIPGGISVEAMHVALTKANVFGRQVSGDFSLDESSAN